MSVSTAGRRLARTGVILGILLAVVLATPPVPAGAHASVPSLGSAGAPSVSASSYPPPSTPAPLVPFLGSRATDLGSRGPASRTGLVPGPPGGANGSIVLSNGTFLPAGVTADNCAQPIATLADPADGVEFTGCANGNLTVVNTTHARLLRTVEVGLYPSGLALDAVGHRLFVADYSNSTIDLLNTTTDRLLVSWPAPRFPYGLGFDAAGNRLFVAASGANAVAVLNATSGTLEGTVPTGRVPSGLALDLPAERGFAANYQDGTLTTFNTSSLEAVATAAVGPSPIGVDVDPLTQEAFVTSDCGSGQCNVSVVNVSTGAFERHIPITGHPLSIVAEPTVAAIYVGIERVFSPSAVERIDLANVSVRTDASVGGVPFSVSLLGPSGPGYAADIAVPNLTAFDPASGRILASIDLGTLPVASAYDTATGDLYVVDGAAGFWGPATVDVVHMANRSVVARLPADLGADGVAVDPANGLVYVANQYATGLTVLNGTTRTSAGTVFVGPGQLGVVYDAETDEILALNARCFFSGWGNVSVINPANRTVVALLPDNACPTSEALDPRTQELFVSNGLGSSVSVINVSARTADSAISVGSSQSSVTVDPGRGTAYALASNRFGPNAGRGSLYVLNTSNASLVGTGRTTSTPVAMGVDPGSGDVLITEVRPKLVAVVNGTGLADVGSIAAPYGANAYGGCGPAASLCALTNTTGTVSLLDLAAIPSAPVTFRVTNLPPGDSWSVSLGSFVQFTTSNTATFSVPIGRALDYAVGPLLGAYGYALAPSSGSIVVSANVTTVPLSVVRAALVTFQELGLPDGTNWSIATELGLSVFNNTTVGSSGLIAVWAPNGSLPFVAPNVTLFFGGNPWGVARVVGPAGSSYSSIAVHGPSLVRLHFAPERDVTFLETTGVGWPGLLNGTAWNVTISPALPGGPPARERSNTSSNGTSVISFVAPQGAKFRYVVSAPPVYKATPARGTLVLRPFATSVSIQFRFVARLVVFRETGLPSGTVWNVTVGSGGPNGFPEPFTGHGLVGTHPVRFELPNGTYNYTVSDFARLHPHLSASSLTVVGGRTALVVYVRYS